jgi:hypothetical protein
LKRINFNIVVLAVHYAWKLDSSVEDKLETINSIVESCGWNQFEFDKEYEKYISENW